MNASTYGPEESACEFGEDVMRALFATYCTANRRGIAWVTATAVLREVTKGHLAGSKLRLPRDVAEALTLARLPDVRNATRTAERAMEPSTGEFSAEVDISLREATWSARNLSTPSRRGDHGRTTATDPRPQWHAEIAAALNKSLAMARASGMRYASLSHLLFAIITEIPEARESLQSAKIDPTRLADSLGEDANNYRDTKGSMPVIGHLEMYGGIRGSSRLVRALQVWARREASRSTPYRSPVLPSVELEIMRQAIRSGSSRVAPGHVLLGVVSTHAQLRAANCVIARKSAPFNRADEALARAGAESITPLFAPASEMPDIADIAGTGRRFWNYDEPLWTQRTAVVLYRSTELARQCQHAQTGTSHVLAALLEEPSDDTRDLLRRSRVDIEALRHAADGVLHAPAE